MVVWVGRMGDEIADEMLGRWLLMVIYIFQQDVRTNNEYRRFEFWFAYWPCQDQR